MIPFQKIQKFNPLLSTQGLAVLALRRKTITFLKVIYLLCVCLPQCMHGASQMAAFESWHTPSTMRVQGIKLGWSDLAASTLIY